MTRYGPILFAALLAAPLAAQETPEEEPHFAGAPLSRLELQALLADAQAAEEAEEGEPSPLVAGLWCVVASEKEDRPAPPTPAPPEGEEAPPAPAPAAEPEDEGPPGCDGGPGLALARFFHGRLAWVAVLGTKTVGTGLAVVPHRPKRGPVFAVAAGVVARYDLATGIEDELHLALGVTASFRGRQP